MRHTVAIILLLAFTALASGMPQRVHQRQHECRDCRVAMLAKIRHSRPTQTPPKPESGDSCQLCFLLHAPLANSSVPVTLVDAGAAPSTILQCDHSPVTAVAPPSIPCRGPPVC